MPFKSYRKESKIDWGRDLQTNENICQEQILLGAVLRIADAMEKITCNYQRLIDDRDYFKRQCEEQRKLTHKAYRQQAALRGVITRIKRSA